MRRPSTRTVHVPQAPSLHPFFAPVSPACSRTQSSNVVRGDTSVRDRLAVEAQADVVLVGEAQWHRSIRPFAWHPTTG